MRMGEQAKVSEQSEGFVHLRVRSAYSLLEGAIKAGKIGDLGRGPGHAGRSHRRPGQPVRGAGVSEAAKGAGVQPHRRLRPAGHRHRRQVAERWAKVPTVSCWQNETGWISISAALSSIGLSRRRRRRTGRAVGEDGRASRGLILLSGGPDGPVDPL
jgi:DNA polymerase-3 subunit alpha